LNKGIDNNIERFKEIAELMKEVREIKEEW